MAVFYKENCDYDGPIGETDGIGYLEFQCFGFNVTNLTNIPPSASGFPNDNTLTLNVGETVNLSPQFIGPEPGQIVTTVVDDGGLCNVDYTITNGELSTVDMQITGAACNVGTHVISFTATDDGVPQQSTTVNLTVIVNEVATNTPPYFNYAITPVDGAEIDVQAGDPISFSVQAKDNDDGDNVTLTAIGVPPGATLTPSLPASGNPVTTQFNWTPSDGDVGTYVVTFTATDNNGDYVTSTVIISVSSTSECDPEFSSYIKVTPRAAVRGQAYHTIYLGYGLQRVLLTALPKGGQAPYTYRWGNGKTSASRFVSPETSTRYNVQITDANGCVSYDNVVVFVIDIRCPDNPGYVFICYNNETMSVPVEEVQHWLDMGATLGSCGSMPTVVTDEASGDKESLIAGNLKPVTTQPASHAFAVFPNPAKNTIRLRWDALTTGNAKVVITDLQGKTVISQPVSGSSQSINISQLVNGMYIARLVAADKTIASSRFVVSK